jgi:hypothetical protein
MKDKNQVYRVGEVVAGADPSTFEVVDTWSYQKDKNYVYYIGKKIIGSSGATFTYYCDLYSKDKNNVFTRGKIIEGADVGTFEVLGQKEYPNYIVYAKDKNAVYHFGKKINGADPATFTLTSSTGARDKSNTYENGKATSLVNGTTPDVVITNEGVIANIKIDTPPEGWEDDYDLKDICSTGVVVVWEEIGRSESYVVTEDACTGYRCLPNDHQTTSLCYTKEECESDCSGICFQPKAVSALCQ